MGNYPEMMFLSLGIPFDKSRVGIFQLEWRFVSAFKEVGNAMPFNSITMQKLRMRTIRLLP